MQAQLRKERERGGFDKGVDHGMKPLPPMTLPPVTSASMPPLAVPTTTAAIVNNSASSGTYLHPLVSPSATTAPSATSITASALTSTTTTSTTTPLAPPATPLSSAATSALETSSSESLTEPQAMQWAYADIDPAMYLFSVLWHQRWISHKDNETKTTIQDIISCQPYKHTIQSTLQIMRWYRNIYNQHVWCQVSSERPMEMPMLM